MSSLESAIRLAASQEAVTYDSPRRLSMDMGFGMYGLGGQLLPDAMTGELVLSFASVFPRSDVFQKLARRTLLIYKANSPFTEDEILDMFREWLDG